MLDLRLLLDLLTGSDPTSFQHFIAVQKKTRMLLRSATPDLWSSSASLSNNFYFAASEFKLGPCKGDIHGSKVPSRLLNAFLHHSSTCTPRCFCPSLFSSSDPGHRVSPAAHGEHSNIPLGDDEAALLFSLPFPLGWIDSSLLMV